MKRKHYIIQELICYRNYKEEYADGIWYTPNFHTQVKHYRTRSKYRKGKHFRQTPWYKPFK